MGLRVHLSALMLVGRRCKQQVAHAKGKLVMLLESLGDDVRFGKSTARQPRDCLGSVAGATANDRGMAGIKGNALTTTSGWYDAAARV